MGNFKKRVGENIKYYRKLQGLTLAEVAKKIGITEATMQKYEAGAIKRVDVEMLTAIANAIMCEPGQLTGWLSSDDKEKAHINQINKKLNNSIALLHKLPIEKQKTIIGIINTLSKEDDNTYQTIILNLKKLNKEGLEDVLKYTDYLISTKKYIEADKSDVV